MKSTVENNIIINNKIVTYVIVYKKIKNIYFRAKEDGKIYVSCSNRVSNKYIESLLRDNADSLFEMLSKVSSRNALKNDIYYLGNKLELVLNDKIYIDNNVIYAPSFDLAKDYIYDRAMDVFSSRLVQIKNNYKDLPEFRLRCRKMKTKWGVCNKSSMTVTLNTELITKDVHLIDYVIVHELCHFKYMNHSPKYWEYVASIYPYYKEARRELNY